MSAFDVRAFSVKLIAESLFYDEEFGAIGNVSLIDATKKKELYIAYFLTEEKKFVIDKVTAWEEYDANDPDAIGYALAIDSNEHMNSESQEAIAKEVWLLAEKEGLVPSVSLFFEEDSE